MDVVLQELSELLISAVDFIPKLVVAIAVFLVSLVVARIAGRSVTRAARHADEEVRRLLGRLTNVAVIIIGTIIALDQVNFDVTGFVAGLGLVGFTLGFAFQDIAKNFMAGVLLLTQQPFEIGDAIEISDYQGRVVDVDIRATTIKAWDGQQIVVPNSEVYTSAIINYSKYPDRRIIVGLRLGYQEDIPRAKEVFLNAIREIEDVLDDPAPAAYCRSLGTSALEMEFFFWVDQRQSSLIEVTSQAVQKLKEAGAREGIPLPYPVQTLRVRQLADEEPL